MLPPIKNDRIKVNDAVHLIASAVHPAAYSASKGSKHDAVKRVRACIKYAYDTGKIGRACYDAERREDAYALFEWAIRKWPALDALDVPRVLKIPSTVIRSTYTTPVTTDPLPQTYDELRELYWECLRKCQKQEAELIQLRRFKEKVIANKSKAGRQPKRRPYLK